MGVQIDNRLESALAKSELNFYAHCPITSTLAEGHPRVYISRVNDYAYVHLHVSILLAPGATVTSNDWLRFFGPGKRRQFFDNVATCLGVP